MYLYSHNIPIFCGYNVLIFCIHNVPIFCSYNLPLFWSYNVPWRSKCISANSLGRDISMPTRKYRIKVRVYLGKKYLGKLSIPVGRIEVFRKWSIRLLTSARLLRRRPSGRWSSCRSHRWTSLRPVKVDRGYLDGLVRWTEEGNPLRSLWEYAT